MDTVNAIRLVAFLLAASVAFFFILRAVRSRGSESAVSPDPSLESAASRAPGAPKPLTFSQLVWGVFLALWFFSLTAGIVAFLIRLAWQ